MRFNFTYFRNIYTNPIVNTIVAEDINRAVELYNADPDQLASIIYDEYIQQLDENTWFHGPFFDDPGNRSGCVITNEQSNFFNIGIYLSVDKNIRNKNTHQSLISPSSALVRNLLFP